MRRSLLLVLVLVSVAFAASFVSSAAGATAVPTRHAQFVRACGPGPSPACDDFLAPVACSAQNPLQSPPFSCRYLLEVNPCHSDPSSSMCHAFVENYCFERPDSVACLFIRAQPGQCSLMSTSGIDPPSDTCQLYPPGSDCDVVEQDGSPPPTPECKLFAAIFLDYCQQRPTAGACGNPGGGRQEGLSHYTRTRPCPTKRNRHRVCKATAASAAATDAGSASPWPFRTITYYVGEVGDDQKIHPAPANWAAPINAGFRAWNAAHGPWTFRLAPSPNRGEADVVALAGTHSTAEKCLGVSGRGFGYTQAFIGVKGTCLKRGVLAFATAHEIGHLLGLAHQQQVCSVMNPGYIIVGGRPRPSQCGPGSEYRGGFVQRSDVRLARAESRPPVSSSTPCDPVDEPPVFAQELACKYRVTCNGHDGRNVFDEPGTLVIDAEIAARCARVLRVRPVGDPLPKRGALQGSSAFAGSSSQGKPVTFALRRGMVRDLRLDVRFACSDNTTQGGNQIRAPQPSADEQALLDQFGIPLTDQRVDGDESIGPFPAVPTTRHGIAASYEAPNGSALYELQASFDGTQWRGTVRIVEGWHSSPLGLFPDPDGEFVCDTGDVSFTALPAPPVTG